MSEFHKILPESMTRLASSHPGVMQALDAVSRNLGFEILKHLEAVSGRPHVTSDDCHQIVEDLRRQAAHIRYHAQTRQYSAEELSMYGVSADVLEQALIDAGSPAPKPIFKGKVKGSSSKLELDYARHCAIATATDARRAIERERLLRMESEMMVLDKGVAKAARIYSRPTSAIVWITVLHELTSNDMDDGFVVMARDLAGLEAPATADAAMLKRISEVRETLRMTGFLPGPVRVWSKDVFMTKPSIAYMAEAGRSLDAHLVEIGASSVKSFLVPVTTNPVSLAEMYAWGLIENPFLQGSMSTRLTPLGQKAAIHFAAALRGH